MVTRSRAQHLKWRNVSGSKAAPQQRIIGVRRNSVSGVSLLRDGTLVYFCTEAQESQNIVSRTGSAHHLPRKSKHSTLRCLLPHLLDQQENTSHS